MSTLTKNLEINSLGLINQLIYVTKLPYLRNSSVFHQGLIQTTWTNKDGEGIA